MQRIDFDIELREAYMVEAVFDFFTPTVDPERITHAIAGLVLHTVVPILTRDLESFPIPRLQLAKGYSGEIRAVIRAMLPPTGTNHVNPLNHEWTITVAKFVDMADQSGEEKRSHAERLVSWLNFHQHVAQVKALRGLLEAHNRLFDVEDLLQHFTFIHTNHVSPSTFNRKEIMMRYPMRDGYSASITVHFPNEEEKSA